MREAIQNIGAFNSPPGTAGHHVTLTIHNRVACNSDRAHNGACNNLNKLEPKRLRLEKGFVMLIATTHTLARIFRLSVLAIALVAQGFVIRYLPGFKLSDPYVTEHATIGDFVAHRTGLPFAAGR